MARLELDQIKHAYGPAPARPEDYALSGVHLTFSDGGAYALLGPSGCGKTTLLNILSGLVRPTEGRVRFDAQDVTHLPTEQRNIAQVFQFPVTYDAMTVRENLAFPLRNRGLRGAELSQRVDAVLQLTDLAALANRRARGLSGIDKQKLSLGRGLVREDVAAILLDEPLTQVDPHIRWSMRSMLKSLHRASGRTMVYVTHDQTEALTFADQVVVMYGGEVVQVGAPKELFERPRHTFVGYFIGSPGMNVLPVIATGGAVRLGAQTLDLTVRPPAGARLELGVRPEHVRIGREGIPARIDAVEDRGRTRLVRLSLEGCELAAIIDEDAEIPAEPRLSFEPGRAHLYADSWRIEPAGEAA
jgi:glycerol transport system ATP-binding protein